MSGGDVNNPGSRGELDIDRLVDAVFDREVPAERSREVFEALSRDPEAARSFTETGRAVEALREPVGSPDFVAGVLGEVGATQGFVTAGERSWLAGARWAIAAAVVVVVGVGFWAERAFVAEEPVPMAGAASADVSDTSTEMQYASAMPVSALVRSTPRAVGASVERVADGAREVRESFGRRVLGLAESGAAAGETRDLFTHDGMAADLIPAEASVVKVGGPVSDSQHFGRFEKRAGSWAHELASAVGDRGRAVFSVEAIDGAWAGRVMRIGAEDFADLPWAVDASSVTGRVFSVMGADGEYSVRVIGFGRESDLGESDNRGVAGVVLPVAGGVVVPASSRDDAPLGLSR